MTKPVIDALVCECKLRGAVEKTLLDLGTIYKFIKPGAYLAVWTTNSLYGSLLVKIEQLGFEVKDLQFYLVDNLLQPIALCRKPFKGNIAKNVLKYHTGGINIDACRLEKGAKKWTIPRGGFWKTESREIKSSEKPRFVDNEKGRWPSNFLYDGSKSSTRCLTDPESLDYFHALPNDTDVWGYLIAMICRPKGKLVFIGTRRLKVQLSKSVKRRKLVCSVKSMARFIKEV